MVAVIELSQTMQADYAHSIIVEIVGPAGAGKSSLYRNLKSSPFGFKGATILPVWKLANVPFFIKNILQLIPLFVRVRLNGDRFFTRREIAWMAMLNGWADILKKDSTGQGYVLLDQGPIFLMSILYGFGPTGLQNAAVQKWWERIFLRWRGAIDLVIWLDAPDEVLMTRIRNRSQDHIVKGKSETEMREFLAKYRTVYDFMMGHLSGGNNHTRVLRFDTSQYSVSQIASIVFSEIDPCK
ncbi:MAG: hypothetical protein ABFD44_03055 [Anaerolineaceae bacterium]